MLDRQILTFNENIIGLRDFISLIGPFLEEHYSRALTEQKQIEETFDCAIQLHMEEDQEAKQNLTEKIKKVFNGQEIEVIKVEKPPQKEKEEEKDLVEEAPEFVVRVPISLIPRIETAYKDLRKTNYQKELLYKNAFIGLLSSVEWFFSQVLHYYYDKHPDAAGIKKKTLTLEDLKTFTSVDDAEKYLIDNKVEELFRGGFDTWVNLLKEEVKLKLNYVVPYFEDLVEVYQRRNLLVHNGGIVNSIYIAKIGANKQPDLKIGDKLSITTQYLEEAICKLQIVFTLISSELWKKLEPKNDRRGLILNSIAYSNMLENRWIVSEAFCGFIKDDEQLKSRIKTVGLLNYWLSEKRNGKFAKVEVEISQADFSDKSLRYQLGKLAISENIEEFFKMLPEALSTKEIDIEELLEFPIFEDIRKSREYVEFISNSNEFKDLRRGDLGKEIPDNFEDVQGENVANEELAPVEGEEENLSKEDLIS